MLQNLQNQDILTLAHLLSGNSVDPETVVRVFKLICERFNCECGMVYDMDFFGNFCLKEHYEEGPVTLRETFKVKELAFKKPVYQDGETMFYVKRHEGNTEYDKHMLNLCMADSMVIAPVVDEQSRTYGLVIFLNIDSQMASDEVAMDSFSVMLSMIVRYVAMRMYERKIAQAQTSLERILDNTGIDIYVNDFYNHDILYVNQSMAKPYGGKQAFLGEKCWRVLFPGKTGPCDFCPQSKLIDENGDPTRVYTWDYQRAFDGSWFRVFSAAFPWVDGRLAHVVSSADITDNKRNEALIENLANYDQLTKLPNRRMLVKECERRIDRATVKEKGYLLFFDIDGFKSINDNYGHDAGDEFLIKLGEFFNSIPLLKDSTYRNGGDEFVAIIGGEGIDKGNIRSLASFIQDRFKKPWQLKKGDVICGTSIGVGCYPEDGVTAEELLQKADMAMYHVKKRGGGGICFACQLDE